MFEQLANMVKKPGLYEKGTKALWTDEHISKGMLESHLNPDSDSATRKHSFVRESVKWISSVAPAEKYRNLLDIGCGPGIYAEEFHKAGYQVSGMDFSERSIEYAQKKNLPIAYYLQDYLSLVFKEQFSVITLINYDFGVPSTEDRQELLQRIYTALKPGGLFIFDVFTTNLFADKNEQNNWQYSEGGFICAEPHVCLDSLYLYKNQSVSCRQNIIITEHDIWSINIWEHYFTKDELVRDLNSAGFNTSTVYGNIAGANYCDNGKEICVVAQKK